MILIVPVLIALVLERHNSLKIDVQMIIFPAFLIVWYTDRPDPTCWKRSADGRIWPVVEWLVERLHFMMFI